MTEAIYSRREPWVNGLGEREKACIERYGVLLPPDYPVEDIARRKTFRQSQWKTFGLCQARSRFEDVERLRPRRRAAPLEVGILTHGIVTGLLTGELHRTRDAVAAECDAWLGAQMARREVAARHGDEPGWDVSTARDEVALVLSMAERWETIASEVRPVAARLKFRVPLVDSLGRRDPVWDFAGELDGIVRGPSEHSDLWVWELKTAAMSDRDEYETTIEHDPQAWGYPWALQRALAVGVKIGVCWDVLRKKAPTAPKFNVCLRAACKRARALVDAGDYDDTAMRIAAACSECAGSGIVALSKATSDTTVALLDAALAELRARSPAGRALVDAGDYDELCNRVAANEGRFAFRIWRMPTDVYSDAFARDIRGAAREYGRKLAAEERGRDEWVRERGNCRMIGRDCPFLPICPPFSADAFERFDTLDSEGNTIERERTAVGDFDF